jgi:long-chain acyl-CoA synthetase
MLFSCSRFADMNLIEMLDSAAGRWPQKPAIIEDSNIISYAGLIEKVAAFASQLQALKVRAGSRVGLSCPNSAAYIALTFALWRIKAIVVPIPTECTDEEISAIAASMQLEALLSQKSSEQSAPLEENIFFAPLNQSIRPDNHGLNIAFIRFTSGTTNARKGVVICHETIRERVRVANTALGIGPDDVVMWCLPMSHHFLITIVLYLSEGATIVLARHVLARPFLEAINHWRGTVLYAAPFHYALLGRDSSGLRISSVRMAVSTTCALPHDVATDFSKRFGLPLSQALGIIELGLVSLNKGGALDRWNSVGRPLSEHHVRIINPDDDGYGEVAVSGPGFFDAYAEPWLPREKVLTDGWFVTGDIGHLDEDGYLFLVSRKTAVINLAGRKVFPEEIEAVLNRHPDVRESRVYGCQHPHLGEIVEADLVMSRAGANPESVRDFCRVNLASFKIPSRLHVVNSLPRTAVTGKSNNGPARDRDGIAWLPSP